MPNQNLLISLYQVCDRGLGVRVIRQLPNCHHRFFGMGFIVVLAVSSELGLGIGDVSGAGIGVDD